MQFQDLVRKYNVPVPRYTSYPTVPVWHDGMDVTKLEQVFKEKFAVENTANGISLYIHLPFCESLCTYCGCNKRITTNHSVEQDYIEAIAREWTLYLDLMNERPVIKELHLGGGTPTFFSPANLDKLLTGIFAGATIHEQFEFSIEGHPNNTTTEHLETLYKLGFRRLSLGVQDNDPEVQRIINRIQPVEHVLQVTQAARAIGFTSVNYDLIYGLPRQTLASITNTIQQTIALRPDRIAFYSYAHVPWTSKGQRLFDESDLLPPDEKMELYQRGKQLFLEAGYVDIGMDHFSLPTDDLYKASLSGGLHRNFMGYTTQHTNILIGLGVSSISTTGNSFAQNAKTLADYYRYVADGALPVEKGYFLTAEDERFGGYILDISCRGKTTVAQQDMAVFESRCVPKLDLLAADGLVTVAGSTVQVTPAGRNFIRNICSAFDLYLAGQPAPTGKKVFSQAI